MSDTVDREHVLEVIDHIVTEPAQREWLRASVQALPAIYHTPIFVQESDEELELPEDDEPENKPAPRPRAAARKR